MRSTLGKCRGQELEEVLVELQIYKRIQPIFEVLDSRRRYGHTSIHRSKREKTAIHSTALYEADGSCGDEVSHYQDDKDSM